MMKARLLLMTMVCLLWATSNAQTTSISALPTTNVLASTDRLTVYWNSNGFFRARAMTAEDFWENIPPQVFSSSVTNFGGLAAKTLWVSPNGDNESGLRENPSRPYQTPAAAQDAAEAGDTVVVLNGFYSVTNLGKDFVSWYLNPSVTLSGGTNSAFAASNMTFWVMGTGSITNSNPTLPVMRIEGASRVRAECTWLGTFQLDGTNRLELVNADIITPNAQWLSGSTNDVVWFGAHTRSLNLPITDAILDGVLVVDTTISP